jgi:3-deoxy-D-manno-octulosonic-acid transferase
MYLLYSLFAMVALIALSPYFLMREMRGKKNLRNFWQRLGKLPREVAERAASGAPTDLANKVSIWIHAVSVGEVLAAAPLARRLKGEFPHGALFISTTTDTGQAIARERIPWADGFFYFPMDFAWVVRRFLRAVRPAAIVIVETEIWPQLLREARRAGVPVIFANARISDRSFRNYRWTNRFLNRFIADALGNATAFMAQSEEDARRLVELGADEPKIEVTGNLKYDLEAPPIGPFAEWLATQARQQERWPVVVAGSVAGDEEEAVLAAYDVVQRQWRRALLVLAPRKPERFDGAAEIVTLGGWKLARRSRLSLEAPLDEEADVLLLDSIGELGGVYSLADTVFIGGSLVPTGGHNLLEPAFFGRAPAFGPHMENFQEMAALFLAERAGVQVKDGEELGGEWVRMIQQDAMRRQMGQAAFGVVQRHRGATDQTMARIAAILLDKTSARAGGRASGGPESAAGGGMNARRGAT